MCCPNGRAHRLKRLNACERCEHGAGAAVALFGGCVFSSVRHACRHDRQLGCIGVQLYRSCCQRRQKYMCRRECCLSDCPTRPHGCSCVLNLSLRRGAPAAPAAGSWRPAAPLACGFTSSCCEVITLSPRVRTPPCTCEAISCSAICSRLMFVQSPHR